MQAADVARLVAWSRYIVYALKRAEEIVAAIRDEKIAPTSDAAVFRGAAKRIGAAVHKAFYRTSSECYGPSEPAAPRQGHQALALVAGVAPDALAPTVLGALVNELTNVSSAGKGHIDTGLTTTYFMGKLLAGGMEAVAGGAASDRADLIYGATLNPTWPSYAALITAGLTTWPETWSIGAVAGGVSKMHGTLNGFGLTFPQAYLGVQHPFSLMDVGSGLRIRPSYFIKAQSVPPPPANGSAPAPPGPPCLGGIVTECGSAPTGTCTAGRELTMKCKSGTIKEITFASWGTPTGTCSSGFTAASSCNDTRAFDIAVAACVGKPSCTIAPSAFCTGKAPPSACPFAGKDPCLGKSKSLAVSASGCEAAPPPPPPPPPPPIPALTAASGTVGTAHGVVNVSWTDGGSSGPVTLEVTIPIGATNTSVWLVGEAETVTESGKPAAAAEGVRLLREATRHGDAYSVWAVGSGSYSFSSHR